MAASKPTVRNDSLPMALSNSTMAHSAKAQSIRNDFGYGSWNRTSDLQLMRLTSYRLLHPVLSIRTNPLLPACRHHDSDIFSSSFCFICDEMNHTQKHVRFSVLDLQCALRVSNPPLYLVPWTGLVLSLPDKVLCDFTVMLRQKTNHKRW